MILGTWGAGCAGYQWGWAAAVVGGVLFGARRRPAARPRHGDLRRRPRRLRRRDQHPGRRASSASCPSCSTSTTRPAAAPPSRRRCPASRRTSRCRCSPRARTCSGDLEEQHWFLVSDVAGLLRGLTSGVGVLTVLAVLLIPAAYLLLWRTAFGLRLRSCGENPAAADSLGVPVYRLKYIAVIISGALAGLGGVFLVFIAGIYREGQTDGRGFIGLAALIFGNWRPGWPGRGRGPVRLRRRPAAAQPQRRSSRCCCWSASCWPWSPSARRCAGSSLQAVLAAAFAAAAPGPAT